MKGIIVIFIFVGSLMSIQFFAFPTIREVRAQWDDIAEMKQILDDAERTKEDRIKYLDRLNNIQDSDLRKLSLLVPNQVVSEDLYVFLDNTIKTAGLEAKTISITEGGSKAGDQNKKVLAFDIAVTGPYTNMRELLRTMELSLRLMDIDSLIITRSQDASKPKSFYSLAIQGKFYYANN